MKTCYLIISIIALLLSNTFANVQAKEIELSGLVIDRTLTRFGKDFVFYYSSYWRDVPQTSGVNVVVYEQVYPQAGTYLWVEMNQKKIYQTYFGRRYNDIKKKAETAIVISVNQLAQVKADAITENLLQQGL